MTDLLLPRDGIDGDAIAFESGGGAGTTYQAMWETVRRLDGVVGQWASDLGQTPRILSLLPDHPTSALAVLMLTRSATVAPVNPALSEAELDAYADRLEPDFALVRADRPDDLARVARLDLPVAFVEPRTDSHCADFDLRVPDRTTTPAKPVEPGLILSTSGSTGAPKLVPLESNQLQASAAHIADWLELGSGDRALHMLPMFHIGAFVDLVMAPLSAGGSVHFGHPITTERLIDAIAHERATWVQLVPTMLHHLLEQADAELRDAASRLRFVRTVSADLAPSLQERAGSLFGDVPIVQMYGMTETAGQITSNPLPPRTARAGTVGLAAGPDIAVMDAHGNPREPGEIGEVCVSGPTVMVGYLDHEGDEVFHGPWFRSGDLGTLDGDGYLTLTGRLKEMINRGGEKIPPVEIERALLTHPDVIEAAAFAIPHETLGEEPLAAAVVSPGSPARAETIAEHAHARLADFKRPRRVVLLDALPRLGSGKIDRVRLKSLAAAGDATGADGGAPSALSPTARTLSKIWMEILGGPAPHPETDFFDAGGDSLSATTFVVRVEETLGVSLPANLLLESPTLGGIEAAISALPERREPTDPLVRAVRRATAGWAGVRAGPNQLLVGRNTFGSKTPFFFITPGLAGSEDLVGAFDAERPVYVMRTLSRLRDRFRRRIKSDANNRRVAALYRDGIAAVRPTGPVLLGGFCQGAEVARLVADALRESGREVALLAVIDRLFTEPVLGRTALVWTAGSHHSGATQFDDPQRHLDLLYPDGATLMESPANHTEALLGDAATEIADFLEREFAAALDSGGERGDTPMSGVWKEARVATGQSGTPSPGTGAWADRKAAHSARIRVRSPRFAAPGSSLRVEARITNESPVSWNGDGGALMVSARWLNLDGHVRTPRSATVEIPDRVASGETVSVELSVPFPDRRLPMLLMVDVVDDGLNWFHWVGNRPGYRLVLPYPSVRNGSVASQR